MFFGQKISDTKTFQKCCLAPLNKPNINNKPCDSNQGRDGFRNQVIIYDRPFWGKNS